MNNYDTGNSCGSEDPNAVKGGFLRYKWDCHQIKTKEVYVLSNRQKPIPVNEIIVTTNDISKSGPTHSFSTLISSYIIRISNPCFA